MKKVLLTLAMTLLASGAPGAELKVLSGNGSRPAVIELTAQFESSNKELAVIEGLLGAFILAMVPMRRWFLSRNFKIGLIGMLAAGAGIGFLTGLVASTGPINTPLFLAYGLTRGPFIATEATGSLAVYFTKSAVFQRFGALPWPMIVDGMIVGTSMMAGAWAGKRIVETRAGEALQSVDDLARRASLDRRDLKCLAAAGALEPLAGHRRRSRLSVNGSARPTTRVTASAWST